MHIPRYLRTLRYLKPAQWWYLPLRRLQRRWPVPRRPIAGALSPARFPGFRAAVIDLGPGDAAGRIARADQILSGTFEFLHQRVPDDHIAWNRKLVNTLWTYHLQYWSFGLDLIWAFRLTGSELYLQRFEALTADWLATPESESGSGWAPHVLSHRTVNWLYAVAIAGDHLTPDLRDAMVASVLEQLGVLKRRQERDLQGNHLQRNLFALAIGSLALDGGASGRWRRRWLPALWREFDRQTNPDGGHAERSPMYHALALTDLLECVTLADATGEPVPDSTRQQARAMWRAWTCLSRPDGTPHLINDSAFETIPAHLEQLGKAVLGHEREKITGAWSLPDTGFYGFLSEGVGERLLIDAGGPAPSHQPGHAHCGALGFELDVAGQPVLVDAGLSGYDGDPLREYVRSTRAHNTVAIDGGEQSEMWGTFRVGGRAAVGDIAVQCAADSLSFAGSCIPYHNRGAKHRRTLEARRGRWEVSDQVEGAVGATLTSYLHFHPAWDVEVAGCRILATAPPGDFLIEAFGVDSVTICSGDMEPRPQGWYCPEFGRAEPSLVVLMKVQHNDGRTFGYRMTVKARE